MELKSKYFDPLARMVASGESVLSASEAVGCGKSTAYRICQTSEFQTEVSRIRTELLTNAMGKLAGAATKAVEIMESLLESPDHSVRLRAAQGILDRFAKLSESIDLRSRIEALEKAQQQTGLKVA
jgi:hypothetical protein